MRYCLGFFLIFNIIFFSLYRTLKINSNKKIHALEAKCEELQKTLEEKEQIDNSCCSDTLQLTNKNLMQQLQSLEETCSYYKKLNRDLLCENNKYYKLVQNSNCVNKENCNFQTAFNSSPSDFYYLKNSLLTRNESLMFYYITETIDALFPPYKGHRTHFVFPQVALYSLLDAMHIQNSSEAKIVSYAYIAKSIDYVVCRCYFDKGRQCYVYQPILLLELDGDSHSSPDFDGNTSLERQQESDKFKNDLINGLNIPFIRYDHRGRSINRQDQFEIQKQIKEMIPRKFLR